MFVQNALALFDDVGEVLLLIFLSLFVFWPSTVNAILPQRRRFPLISWHPPLTLGPLRLAPTPSPAFHLIVVPTSIPRCAHTFECTRILL